MRTLITLALAGAALTGLTSCTKAAPGGGVPGARPLAEQDMPHRKPGLWRQSVVVEGANTPLPDVQACSDAVSETKLNLLGQHRSRDLCQDQNFSRDPDGSIGFSVRCDLGPKGVTVSTGAIKGDFGSRYQIAMDSKTTGAKPDALNTEHKIAITATWIGPCRPGQRGGDLVLADGGSINLTDAHPVKRFP